MAVIAACMIARPAHAGPVEALVQVALHPKDPKVMALRYEYGGEGVFITQDGGATWGYVCNSYIDPSMNARRGMLSVAGDGAMLLGVFDGVWEGDKNGCDWALGDTLKGKWVPDIAQDPTDPDVLYAITSNGNEGALNGVVKRDASGAWSDLGAKEAMLITRLRVVKNGDGVRLYESAVNGMTLTTVNGMEQAFPNYFIRFSDDLGETWQEFPFVSMEVGAFRLMAVDPSNPDRIVAWIDRDVSTQNQDSIMVSSDKGETFTEYTKVTDLGGIDIADDGRVWIADRGATTDPDAPRGLFAAANLDTAPTLLAGDQSYSCVAYRDDADKLYACQLRKFGSVDLESGEFTALFTFNKVEHFVQCGGTDMAGVCEMQLCRDYCALGHFPETPMCVAYQTMTCGPCAAIPEAPGCTKPGGMAGSGGSGGSGGSAAGGGGASGNTGSMTAGVGGGGATAGEGGSGKSGGEAGQGEPPKDDGDGGGCSAVNAGAARAEPRGAHCGQWLLAVFGLGLWLRKRERSRT